MMILRNFPLLVIPLVIYNVLAYGTGGATGVDWQAPAYSFDMLSGATFDLTLGGVLILFALVLLFIEILKATRTAKATIIDHLASTLVFLVYLVQFLVDPTAASTTYVILAAIAFLDVVAGYSVSIRVASRDVTFDRQL
ncbi:MAG: hypothetical protein AAGE89_16620 [Pseudomonadota bacterium]